MGRLTPGNSGSCNSLILCWAVLCYAKSLQLCPTLCDPIDGSPPGSPVPGILQARVLEWGAIAFSDIGLDLAFRWGPGCLGIPSLSENQESRYWPSFRF